MPRDKEDYPCFGVCTNKSGGYSCVCSPGKQGDPFTDGACYRESLSLAMKLLIVVLGGSLSTQTHLICNSADSTLYDSQITVVDCSHPPKGVSFCLVLLFGFIINIMHERGKNPKNQRRIFQAKWRTLAYLKK
ncbi:uncharacterized protein LOC122010140 isoform X2 [Zingiber officinale]|uniref:uncharacterized protein LOC122010140 isoform X2 n=1 Tax=Zingiber officinale TaxID=94328 RepID=UPI001C4B0E0F|nr:uncharacterized protein LOC122010140 isoform X2 [Zingiber officinale]